MARLWGYLVGKWALGCTLKLVHCISLYSTAFPKLKFKISKNLNTFELVTKSFYNWGFPPSLVLSSFSISLHKGFANIFVSFLRANIFWACDLNHFHTYEFTSWLQVTSTNDLILNTIWLLIARLISRINASTLFFTLAMVPWSPSHRLPFT